MIQLPDDRRPTITPQLAVRVAIMGGVALTLFAIIFFRLWFLQVLSGNQYLAEAQNNQVRNISTQAPRGDVVDRDGTKLVTSRAATAVQVEVQSLPAVERDLAALYGRRLSRAERHRLAIPAKHRPRSVKVKLPALPARATSVRRYYRRLARVLGISPQTIHRRVLEQVSLTPYANVTLKTDVPRSVLNYLSERQDSFPGVTVQRVYLRSYPHQTLAAQLFGTVGEISPGDHKLKRFRGVPDGTIVGKGGVEYSYDRYLRGRDGATRVQVDALGQRKGTLAERQPVQGKQLKLSLDLSLQAEGQRAIGRAIGLANGPEPRDGGRLRGDGPHQRRDPRDGLLPELRPQRVRAPHLAGEVRLDPGRAGRAAV